MKGKVVTIVTQENEFVLTILVDKPSITIPEKDREKFLQSKEYKDAYNKADKFMSELSLGAVDINYLDK